MARKNLPNFRFQFSLRALLMLVTGVAVIAAMLNTRWHELMPKRPLALGLA